MMSRCDFTYRTVVCESCLREGCFTRIKGLNWLVELSYMHQQLEDSSIHNQLKRQSWKLIRILDIVDSHSLARERVPYLRPQ